MRKRTFLALALCGLADTLAMLHQCTRHEVDAWTFLVLILALALYIIMAAAISRAHYHITRLQFAAKWHKEQCSASRVRAARYRALIIKLQQRTEHSFPSERKGIAAFIRRELRAIESTENNTTE